MNSPSAFSPNRWPINSTTAKRGGFFLGWREKMVDTTKKALIGGAKALMLSGIAAGIGIYTSVQVINSEIAHIKEDVVVMRNIIVNKLARSDQAHVEIYNKLETLFVQQAEVRGELKGIEREINRKGHGHE